MNHEADSELIETAKKYMAILERAERTSNATKLRQLEHQRVDLHWDLIKMPKKRRIQFRDRNHATEIAKQMSKQS